MPVFRSSFLKLLSDDAQQHSKAVLMNLLGFHITHNLFNPQHALTKAIDDVDELGRLNLGCFHPTILREPEGKGTTVIQAGNSTLAAFAGVHFEEAARSSERTAQQP